MTEVEKTHKLSLLAKFGARYSLEPAKVYETLCKTAFADAQNQEQVIALLVVADQYGLNPFTKEIYAFPDKKGGVVPVVGIDGWNRIAQQHPQFDGVELRYSEEYKQLEGARPCPEWAEAIVYRKDREHPVVVREYLDECYRKTGPWQSHTKRMLRHKALIQGYRVAFGFHGIYDPDEAEGFGETEYVMPEHKPVASRVAERLGVQQEEAEEAEWHEEPVTDEQAETEAAEAESYWPAEEPPAEPAVEQPQSAAPITIPQSRALNVAWRKLAESGYDEARLRNILEETTGKRSRKELDIAQASEVIKRLNAEVEAVKVP